ncbi:hypothetical protein HMI54_008352 [Coelomomyces lativittatus]|nr:hypothetical protein HMI54_008352 [Coelomomyces lativittatus]KAJ1515730.1 hypothetical protein HMI56_001705 [Coelomomyces lativittatus]
MRQFFFGILVLLFSQTFYEVWSLPVSEKILLESKLLKKKPSKRSISHLALGALLLTEVIGVGTFSSNSATNSLQQTPVRDAERDSQEYLAASGPADPVIMDGSY